MPLEKGKTDGKSESCLETHSLHYIGVIQLKNCIHFLKKIPKPYHTLQQQSIFPDIYVSCNTEKHNRLLFLPSWSEFKEKKKKP